LSGASDDPPAIYARAFASALLMMMTVVIDMEMNENAFADCHDELGAAPCWSNAECTRGDVPRKALRTALLSGQARARGRSESSIQQTVERV
jgi:hypothetical protein